jgi:tetratricopeptide (TPR) repeat protein
LTLLEKPMLKRLVLIGLAFLSLPLTLRAQVSPERDRARPYARAAWESMRTESWADAARAFQQAIDADREFEDAYYGLGLANMRLKNYAAAIQAYVKCRDLYQALTGKQFSNRQEAQRYRQDRMTEIDEVIRQLNTGPQTQSTQERLRQLQEQKRQIQEYAQRSAGLTVGQSVPAFVYIALGSAYFRIEQWADAEREYKAAIASDPKSGEAFNNLAVVYLQTGRAKEADEAIRSAERAGYKVHPQLKADIKAKVG